jgi:hypothetical protein
METETVTQLIPESDRDFLIEKEFEHDIIPANGALHIVIRDFELPEAYIPAKTELLIILPAGYPNAALDMFWTAPDVMLKNGSWPTTATHHEDHHGKNWQRWSRHIAWRAGQDNLRTFITAIRKEINKGI